ncbi:hypothetical protein, conserved [Eimeria praecox]|uniref:Protein kinase domain-containing protein n=1 Tax=Eimeria praecox TaxID=51316 RepID=U6GGJ6_9EIME|nr:hypothetical protein, conserved [Eimeria praecox]
MEVSTLEELNAPSPPWGGPQVAPLADEAGQAEALSTADDDVFMLLGTENQRRRHQRRIWGRLLLVYATTLFLLAVAFGGYLLRSVSSVNWRKGLSSSWKGVSPPEAKWEVPSLIQFENSLTPSLRAGKELVGLTASLQAANLRNVPSQMANEVMQSLAEHISNGQSKDLIGMKLTLTSMQALDSAEVDEIPRTYEVTGFLGAGGRSVALEVKEEDTGKTLAMKLFTVAVDPSYPSLLSRISANLDGYRRIVQETTAMHQASGKTNLSEAGEARGLALASGFATIKGVPAVMRCPSVYLLGEVELMERFCGDLLGIFTPRNGLPLEAKEYAAKRMLLEVLHLQHAGFSHNDLKLLNFFVREDGSFFLGDFESGTPIGHPLDKQKSVTVIYAEKELAVAAMDSSRNAGMPVVNEKSDMWSLGLSLYSIFTNGKLPYGLQNSDNPAETLKAAAFERVSARTLRKPLTEAGVPQRWQDLIVDLLQVDREDRIDAATLVTSYADIIN